MNTGLPREEGWEARTEHRKNASSGRIRQLEGVIGHFHRYNECQPHLDLLCPQLSFST